MITQLISTICKKIQLFIEREWIHIRYAVHILNLVVKDDIRLVDKLIENIRIKNQEVELSNLKNVSKVYHKEFDT